MRKLINKRLGIITTIINNRVNVKSKAYDLNTDYQRPLKEIYKDVLSYEGIYQVSNLGNVKSLKFNKERILKPALSDGRYLTVVLSKNGKKKTNRVHKLVAMAFLGHKPKGHLLTVDHINNVKTDNRLENLQLITQRENCSKDRFRKDYSSKYVGVSWHKNRNKWEAQILIKGKPKNLGFFTDELKASNAYQKELNLINSYVQFTNRN